MAHQIPVTAEKRSRLSTLQPPLWATWSLNAATESEWKSRNQKANERLAVVLNNLSKNPQPPKKESHWSKFSIRSMLQDGSENAIHASDWKTYHEEDTVKVKNVEPVTYTDKHSDFIDEDRIGSLSLEVGKLQPLMTSVLEQPSEAIGMITPEMLEPGYFDYSPLLPNEEEEIERFLRVTGYKPEKPNNQKSEHDTFRESYRRSLTVTSKDCSQLEDEMDPFEISKKLVRLKNKVHYQKASEDVPGRQAFINMCKLTMPTRHSDWLLQKVYEDSIKETNKIASSSVFGESFKKAKDRKEFISTEEAIDMVKKGTMPFDKAAIVMHALASASNLRTKDLVISRHYSDNSHAGSKQKKRIRERCRTESVALLQVIKVLFPHYFQSQSCDNNDSEQVQASVQDALKTIKATKAGVDGQRKRKATNQNADISQEKEEDSDNPFSSRMEGKLTREERSKLRLKFQKRQVKLTQDLYDDLELQSEDDEEEGEDNSASSESEDSDWKNLDEGHVPLDGILELQEWLESCHSKASYKKFREHISDLYDGKIPAWIEERLDPQYKMRLKGLVHGEPTEQEALTNVERELRRRKEIAKKTPYELRTRKLGPSLAEARVSAREVDRKEQKEGLRKKYEQEMALKKEAKQIKLKQKQRNSQQAELERQKWEADERARKERLDCQRAMTNPKETKVTVMKDETESEAKERIQKALMKKADEEIAYLEKNEEKIRAFKNELQSLKPSKRLRKKGAHHLTQANKEKSRMQAAEKYSSAREKWLASINNQ